MGSFVNESYKHIIQAFVWSEVREIQNHNRIINNYNREKELQGVSENYKRGREFTETER